MTHPHHTVFISLLLVFTAMNPPVVTHGPVQQTEHYRIFDPTSSVSRETIRAVMAGREQAYDRIQSFLDGFELPPRIDYLVYPTFEIKGLTTGNTTLAHIDRDQTAVHLVVNNWVRGDDPMFDARLLIREALGKPLIAFLEMGLAVYFSEGWRGKDYEYWASRLYLSDNLPDLMALFDNSRLYRESYLVAEPVAGTFVASLIHRFGRETFLEHYATWQPGKDEIRHHERGWLAYLEKVSKRHVDQIQKDRAVFPKTTGFLKGFCHAHEGYQIFNGYASKKSDEALEKLVSLGTTSVSITPFTYMRDPRQPVYLRFSNRAGSENDESVIHSACTAKALGMSVMLKPHIWLRDGHWPGDIEMASAADWERFFDYYYRWILHYALLAEMYEVELLCVGVEMVKTTVGHEAEWIALIKKLRAIYSGQLTYAANWGAEIENVEFWDAFDYIGVNCYYPLAKTENATPDDLDGGAKQVVDRLRAVHDKFEKPILLTEIGFTSTPAPWRNPHEAAWRKSAHPDDQALCYEAIFKALHGHSWCRGIYWWKWPSFLEYGGPQNAGFTPNSKPAEGVVRKWYAKTW